MVVEQILHLLGDGGHNGVVEERIETCEQESADNNGDQDLDAGIDVAFGLNVVNGGLGADGELIELVLDFVEKLSHFFLTSFH